eukprot:scaffold220577_cov27-Tisochrysis_lutea.AAC.1
MEIASSGMNATTLKRATLQRLTRIALVTLAWHAVLDQYATNTSVQPRDMSSECAQIERALCPPIATPRINGGLAQKKRNHPAQRCRIWYR